MLSNQESRYVELRAAGATPLEAATVIYPQGGAELLAIDMEGTQAVQVALQEAQQVTQSRRGRIRESMGDNLVAIVNADVRNLFQEDGSIKKGYQLDAQTALAVQKIKVVEKTTPFGETVSTTEYTFYNKLSAIELLSKNVAKTQQDDTINIDNLVDLSDEELNRYHQKLLNE